MKDDALYIKHIADCIRLIGDFTREGEATKRLSEKFRTGNPEIPWQEIAGMRDKLIHDYFGVNLHRVWQTVCEDLPPLRIAVTKALANQL